MVLVIWYQKMYQIRSAVKELRRRPIGIGWLDIAQDQGFRDGIAGPNMLSHRRTSPVMTDN